MTAIAPDALRERMDGPEPWAVLDVREPMAYAEAHVPGSTLVPRRVLEPRLPELVPQRDTAVTLVHADDAAAASDARWLAELGWENVSYLAGGVDAWHDAGFESVTPADGIYASSFNRPSKAFGEAVAAARDPPKVGPDRLAEWLEAGEDVRVVDVRTPGEYRSGTVPGAVNVQGMDLPAVAESVRGDEKLVVHCAGRTRSIINAATLDARGLDDVYALEDGTAGWTLAGHDLETGADRERRADELPDEAATQFAERILDDREIDRLSVDEFAALLAGDDTVYPFDVRSRAEYEAGHIPDTLGVPGGQAIQRADDHVAVTPATVVLVSRSSVRAALTAYWFDEMDVADVAVLDGGVDAWTGAGRPLEEGGHREETPGLSRAIEQRHGCRSLPAWGSVRERATLLAPDDVDPDAADVLFVGRSAAFREAHVPGSRWASRTDLTSVVESALDDGSAGPIVLSCPDGVSSTYAAAALAREGLDVAALDGGLDAWREAGRAVATGDDGLPEDPPDVVPSTSEQGEAFMRGYLQWERDLAR